jgi:hypothetical protein
VCLADSVSPCKSTRIEACVHLRLPVWNGAFVETFFRVGHSASVRELNLIIIYQCVRVRERTYYLAYEISTVRGNVLEKCGIYVFVCRSACKFDYIQARLISSGETL